MASVPPCQEWPPSLSEIGLPPKPIFSPLPIARSGCSWQSSLPTGQFSMMHLLGFGQKGIRPHNHLLSLLDLVVGGSKR